MKEIKILQMVFNTTEGKKKTINVSNIKDDATEAEFKTLMDALVATNILETSVGDLVSCEAATLVIKQTNSYAS